MKTIFMALVLMLSCAISAQQSHEFKEIKDYFDSQKELLKVQFHQKYLSEKNPLYKKKIKADYMMFMQKIDSVRNSAYLGALIRVKNTEDLNKIITNHGDFVNNKNVETPTFPNGIDSLRKKVAELFYSEAIKYDGREINAVLSFVVEKDGTISDVRAEGDVPAFNKQAEIALYLLPDKFEKPGKIDGNAVRYMFKMPLRMRLD